MQNLIKLLENLSKSLNETYSAKSVVSTLGDFFAENFKMKSLEIYTRVANSDAIRDFSQSWVINDKADELKYLFEDLSSENIIVKNNYIYYPFYRHNKKIGMLRLEGDISEEFLEFMKIGIYEISLKIQNIILAEKMQKSIDFHDSMKNIAKIIESQYELNYIIPLIGEMIDKFISNHLIYIFLKDQLTGEFHLAWPNMCRDERIFEMIKTITPKSVTMLTNEGKTGIFPLIEENKVLGCIVTKSTDGKLTSKELEYIQQLVNQTATTINRANIYGEILKHATLDALTGFYNRRQLEERIKQEVASAVRQKTSLCAIMTDIDHFKQVNDTYGHAVGDEVLRTVAKTIRAQLREYDIAGRYGGEEFAILLPFTRLEEAKMVAERLRSSVEKRIVDISRINADAETKSINVTISLGVYEFNPRDKDGDLLKKADKALYTAKETGRNRVVISEIEKDE